MVRDVGRTLLLCVLLVSSVLSPVAGAAPSATANSNATTAATTADNASAPTVVYRLRLRNHTRNAATFEVTVTLDGPSRAKQYRAYLGEGPTPPDPPGGWDIAPGD